MPHLSELVRSEDGFCYRHGAPSRAEAPGLHPISLQPAKIGHSGSSLFPVELEVGQAELAGDKVKHGDQIFAGTVTASFAFSRLEHAVEPFHEGVGQPPFPMGQNALEVGLDHLCDLEHREEYVTHVLLGDPAHPTAPG